MHLTLIHLAMALILCSLCFLGAGLSALRTERSRRRAPRQAGTAKRASTETREDVPKEVAPGGPARIARGVSRSKGTQTVRRSSPSARTSKPKGPRNTAEWRPSREKMAKLLQLLHSLDAKYSSLDAKYHAAAASPAARRNEPCCAPAGANRAGRVGHAVRSVPKHHVMWYQSSDSWKELTSSSSEEGIAALHQSPTRHELSAHAASRPQTMLHSSRDRIGAGGGDSSVRLPTQPRGWSHRAAFDKARQYEVIEASRELECAVEEPLCPVGPHYELVHSSSSVHASSRPRRGMLAQSALRV